MTPLQTAFRICNETSKIIERSQNELAGLRQRSSLSQVYNEAARDFLLTASWKPASQSLWEKSRPVFQEKFRSDSGGWKKRAEETRLLAGRIMETEVKRAMLEIAEGYDRLGGGDPMPNLQPASPGTSALAA